MDFLINNIESIKSVEIDKPSAPKKAKVMAVDIKKSEDDKVNISNELKNFQDKLVESHKYKKDLDKAETLSKSEIKEFQAKITNFQKNYEGIEDNIVYSLMTLPAFQGSKNNKSTENLTINKELEEIKKIENDLNSGGKMDEVLEDAIKYLMKSLLS